MNAAIRAGHETLGYDIFGNEVMATFGRIEKFDSANEDWQQYEERLGIESAKKRAVLLTVVSATTYKLLRNLVAPSKLGEKSYAQLTSVLSSHFNPAPSPIVRRFKFHALPLPPARRVYCYVRVSAPVPVRELWF